MSSTDMHEIDPQGDVVFVLKKTADVSVRVRVSSARVSDASPVLKAMLLPRFSEGATLSLNGYVEVSLHEDDSDAAIIIFKAIHGRHLPSDLSLEDLKKTAVMADKYDFVKAPGFDLNYERWLRYWLDREERPLHLANNQSSINTLCQLLEITYLLGTRSTFEHIGHKLVSHSTSPINGYLPSSNISYVFEALEAERQRVANGMLTWLTYVIAYYAGIGKNKDCRGKCNWAAKFGSGVVHALMQAGVLDAAAIHPDQRSFHAFMMGIRKIQFQWQDYNDYICSKYCMAYDPDIESKLNSLDGYFESRAAAAEQYVGSLCLPCIKDGHGPFRAEECGHKDE